MAQEARSHLFIKPNEDDGSVHQNAAADMPTVEVTESQGRQMDDGDQVEAVGVIRHVLTESPSHADRKNTSRRHLDQKGVERVHYQTDPDAAVAGKQDARTVGSSHKLSNDDHAFMLKKSKDKEMTLASSRNETSRSLPIPRKEKHKKSRTTADVQQLVSDKPEDSKTKLKKSSRSKHEMKAHSHSSGESRPPDKKSTNHILKSVVVQLPDKTKTGSADKNSSGNGNSCQKSSRAASDDEIIRIIMRSFDEVCPLSCNLCCTSP